MEWIIILLVSVFSILVTLIVSKGEITFNIKHTQVYDIPDKLQVDDKELEELNAEARKVEMENMKALNQLIDGTFDIVAERKKQQQNK